MENGREPSLRVFNLEGVFDDVKVAWECGCSRWAPGGLEDRCGFGLRHGYGWENCHWEIDLRSPHIDVNFEQAEELKELVGIMLVAW